MSKQSKTFLESIPNEVASTAREMADLATDLEALCVDISLMTPEQMNGEFKDMHLQHLKEIYSIYSGLSKAIKLHNLAVDKLQTFKI